MYFTMSSPVTSLFLLCRTDCRGKRNPTYECGSLSAAMENVSSKLQLFCPALYGRRQNFVVTVFVSLLDVATSSNTMKKEEQPELDTLMKNREERRGRKR